MYFGIDSINTSQCFSVRPTLCPTDNGNSKLVDQRLLLYWLLLMSGLKHWNADRMCAQCSLTWRKHLIPSPINL